MTIPVTLGIYYWLYKHSAQVLITFVWFTYVHGNLRLSGCWIMIANWQASYIPFLSSWLDKKIEDKNFEAKQKTLKFLKIGVLKIFWLYSMQLFMHPHSSCSCCYATIVVRLYCTNTSTMPLDRKLFLSFHVQQIYQAPIVAVVIQMFYMLLRPWNL